VVFVNTADEGGGAERIAWTLFKGLERRGVDAWLAVGAKRTDDPRVVPFFQSPHVDYRPYSGRRFRLWHTALRRLERQVGLEDFRHPYSRHLLGLTGAPPALVSCVNLHGGFFDLRSLAPVSRRVPVVLNLLDCWMLTGHCAYPVGCPRWEHGCGTCPDLSLPPALRRDATWVNWRRKRAIYRRARFFVTVGSQWLAQRLERSILAPAVEECRAIPYGVDLATFRPALQLPARQALGIPPDAFSVLFVANLGRDNPYKDYPTLRAAMEELARDRPSRPVHFLVVGKDGPTERLGDLVIRHAPYLRSAAEVAMCYQAADLYLHAAREEAFGLVIAEAMACGLPVVATAVGAIPEVIDDGRDGLLVSARDPGAMAAAARRLRAEPGLRERLGRAAGDTARRRFDQEVMIDRHREWYAALVDRGRRDQRAGCGRSGWTASSIVSGGRPTNDSFRTGQPARSHIRQ
jgi:glycosyltransferase involved in cell wall biosynthesis